MEKIKKNCSFMLIDYYPSYFQVLSLNSPQIINSFCTLLPTFISNNNFIDILNKIIDLPLIANILENNKRKLDNKINLEKFISQPDINSKDWKIGYSNLIKLWKEENLPVSAKAVMNYVPEILDRFFETILNTSNPDFLRDIIPAIFTRLSYIFPGNKSHVTSVQKVLLKNLQKIFMMHPFFVVNLQDYLQKQIANRERKESEIFIYISTIISDSLCFCKDEELKMNIVFDYYNSFATKMYENMALLKARIMQETKEKVYKDTKKIQEFLVLINSMSKIVARFKDYIPKFQNLLEHVSKDEKDIFHPIIKERALTVLKFLKFPSVLKTVFWKKRFVSEEKSSEDEDSSLSFILKTFDKKENYLDNILK